MKLDTRELMNRMFVKCTTDMYGQIDEQLEKLKELNKQ